MASRVLLPAAILGWALSGFFDGILLHQVLEWHHLLSLVPGEYIQRLRTQILADGLFHVLMYGFALWGLTLLFRRRAALAAPGARRMLLGGFALGFGLWNVVDVVGFHWLLGIHRIRVNVPDPMAYDLGWLAVFALPQLLLAWRWLRRPGGGGAHPAATAAVVAALVAGAGGLAARPVPGTRTAVVLFAPATGGGAAFDHVHAAGARPLWVDPTTGLRVVSLDRPGAAVALRSRALVTRSPALAGCLAAVRS